MTQEFDLHAAIRKLAEAELPCKHPKLLAWDIPGASRECVDCGGTGRIVPFAALRVYAGHESCREDSPCKQVWKPGAWVPEPDVEKACWRVWKALPQDAQKALVKWHHLRATWEEAVLREAEAWLKEQHE